jgi:mycothiol system anti-sigma-R factor
MHPRSCDDALANVYSFLDKEMTMIRLWRVRRHLKGCEPCCSAYTFEERLQVVIRQRLKEDVPEEMMVRLRQVLRRESSGA